MYQVGMKVREIDYFEEKMNSEIAFAKELAKRDSEFAKKEFETAKELAKKDSKFATKEFEIAKELANKNKELFDRLNEKTEASIRAEIESRLFRILHSEQYKNEFQPKAREEPKQGPDESITGSP